MILQKFPHLAFKIIFVAIHHLYLYYLDNLPVNHLLLLLDHLLICTVTPYLVCNRLDTSLLACSLLRNLLYDLLEVFQDQKFDFLQVFVHFSKILQYFHHENYLDCGNLHRLSRDHDKNYRNHHEHDSCRQHRHGLYNYFHNLLDRDSYYLLHDNHPLFLDLLVLLVLVPKLN